MSVIHIESPADPRIADYQHIPEPEFVQNRGWLVAEGRLVVERVIDDARCTIRSLLVSPAAYQALEPKLRAIAAATPIYVCSPGRRHQR